MPKPPKNNEDAKDEKKKKKGSEESEIGNLSRPVRKTSMEPAKDHPQRIVMTKREMQRPCETLESWFDFGLMKQKPEGAAEEHHHKKFVTGARPLPAGYSGCNEGQSLITSDESQIFVWPLRLFLSLGADEKKPWTLYHYTHQPSFDSFHTTFLDMHNMDLGDAYNALLDLLQRDYQERVPQPTAANTKSEPMLSLEEPIKFATKEDTLHHIFGRKDAAALGYSKQGNKFDTFADYCIAFQLPHSACFENVNQASGCNVRICRDTLTQMENKAAKEKHEANKKKKKEAAAKDSDDDTAKVGCLCRLCGLRRPEKSEFWDDEKGEHARKKKDREVDRWKQRLAKKWLEEHVEETAAKRAKEEKKQEEDHRQAQIDKQKQMMSRSSHSAAHSTMMVNKARKEPGVIDFGITKNVNRWVARFQNLTKKKIDPDAPYRQNAAKEVVQASSLFTNWKQGGGRSNDSLDSNEAKPADDSLKRRRVNEDAQVQKVAHGTKRRIMAKKHKMPGEKGEDLDEQEKIAKAEVEAIERAHEEQHKKELHDAKKAAHHAKHHPEEQQKAEEEQEHEHDHHHHHHHLHNHVHHHHDHEGSSPTHSARHGSPKQGSGRKVKIEEPAASDEEKSEASTIQADAKGSELRAAGTAPKPKEEESSGTGEESSSEDSSSDDSSEEASGTDKDEEKKTDEEKKE